LELGIEMAGDERAAPRDLDVVEVRTADLDEIRGVPRSEPGIERDREPVRARFGGALAGIEHALKERRLLHRQNLGSSKAINVLAFTSYWTADRMPSRGNCTHSNPSRSSASWWWSSSASSTSSWVGRYWW